MVQSRQIPLSFSIFPMCLCPHMVWWDSCCTFEYPFTNFRGEIPLDTISLSPPGCPSSSNFYLPLPESARLPRHEWKAKTQ